MNFSTKTKKKNKDLTCYQIHSELKVEHRLMECCTFSFIPQS